MRHLGAAALAFACIVPAAQAQVAVRGRTVYTMAGAPLTDATVLVRDGKIAAIGRTADVAIPEGFRVIEADVVTPGLIDAHSTVGFSGIFNAPHDQDQLEESSPMQPELRAVDAYNAREDLVAWVRGFGVTTLHTGHAPGQLISGQTMIVKTSGDTVGEALVVESRAVAVTLGSAALKTGSAAPGTRAKMLAMLRSQFIKAQEYRQRLAAAAAEGSAEGANAPVRDLGLETLVRVLDGELALLVTADRAQDIAGAIRLAEEFQFQLWLDSAAEAYVLIDEIKNSGASVVLHPTLARAVGDRENLSFETASRLAAAGIPVALASGYESYVPKTRVVLFEAAVAAANGLGFEGALATITIDAARILGIDERVGSLEVGKDGDLALYDGDPFEYTTHCIGVVIGGIVESDEQR